MSAEDRQVLAAAANTVSGLNVSEYYRQSFKAGDGAVQIVSGTVPSKFDRMNTWRVYVAISQDVKTAEKWIDAHIKELIDALWPVLVITTWAPQELVTESGLSINGLYIEGNRAQD